MGRTNIIPNKDQYKITCLFPSLFSLSLSSLPPSFVSLSLSSLSLSSLPFISLFTFLRRFLKCFTLFQNNIFLLFPNLLLHFSFFFFFCFFSSFFPACLSSLFLDIRNKFNSLSIIHNIYPVCIWNGIGSWKGYHLLFGGRYLNLLFGGCYTVRVRILYQFTPYLFEYFPKYFNIEILTLNSVYMYIHIYKKKYPSLERLTYKRSISLFVFVTSFNL